LTSIGTPSKVGTVVALPPHSRTPSAATVHGTAPPKTLGIAACAAGAKARAPAMPISAVILRINANSVNAL
jgi:hypothetical protein